MPARSGRRSPLAYMWKKPMTEHHFTLVLAPDPGLEDGSAVEALGEAGATDSTVGRGPDGVWSAVFDREAPTFEAALKSAIADVQASRLVVRT